MDNLYKRALFLEYFTVCYNLLEAFVSILFGTVAHSIALIGFGLDSIVESLSGMVLVWRLRKHGKISAEREEQIERRAQTFVAVTFFILAIYIVYESIGKLFKGEIPDPSLPGIIIAFVSIIVMPILMILKYRIGKQINSKALIADSKETFACALLSVALLIGLGSNYLFGFWQADPIVGLIISVFLVREGIENWQDSRK
ncbi:MAG: cation diffusion facilitator family transporter [candidate division WOR-3 bacterium]|nr:MAG: cation diffusion facilitator family transporter [candidate division WOR-3 bacterium]